MGHARIPHSEECGLNIMTETELLFTETLNCSRTDLYLNKDIILDKCGQSFISSVLKRRLTGEPLSYILGKTEFMGLEFKVTPDVLIPRQDTEILVETAIELGFRVSGLGSRIRILDIGTGSGCIAVSLAKFLPCAKITAIDISEKAIAVAKQNALSNNVNIDFLLGDLFPIYEPTAMSYELIISNPPYIPSAEINGLQPEIQFEPRIALDGGKDGLDFYHRIIACAPTYLRQGGLLILEAGYNQKDKIRNILKKSRNFEIIEVVKDYSNIDRVFVVRAL